MSEYSVQYLPYRTILLTLLCEALVILTHSAMYAPQFCTFKCTLNTQMKLLSWGLSHSVVILLPGEEVIGKPHMNNIKIPKEQ